MLNEIIGRLPTIPEYYSLYIDKSVDLTITPKQCCPFHNEDTPSFSYSAERGKWRCFGSCKTGGDVIALHQRNYKLSSREEAERSLNALHKVCRKPRLIQAGLNNGINQDKVEDEVTYQKAILLADRPERWVELDYVMSKTPVDYIEVNSLINKWKGGKEDNVL